MSWGKHLIDLCKFNAFISSSVGGKHDFLTRLRDGSGTSSNVLNNKEINTIERKFDLASSLFMLFISLGNYGRFNIHQ